MEEARKRARRYLKKIDVALGKDTVGDVCDDFEGEMNLGLSAYGSASSLMMIPTFVKIDDKVPVDEPAVVIDAGGTNLRTAVVRFDKELRCTVDRFENRPMPGSRGALSKDAFFAELAGYIAPLLSESRKVGFCFSYPVSILPNRDGRVLSLSKEVRVDGLIGELMNASLAQALEAMGVSHVSGAPSFTLLNDTVATLLGGKAASPGRVYDGYVGFILGTGTNASYVESCERIGKLSSVLPSGERFGADSMLINIESGNFAKAPRGKADISLDEKTKDRGAFTFEKAISGAYQGPLLNEIVAVAARDGLFGDGSARDAFASLSGVTARDIDAFLDRPFGDGTLATACSGASDSVETLYWIIDAMYERIAMFVVGSLTAILRRTGKGRSPCAPACITADGTTFYKARLLRPKVDRYVHQFMNEECGRYCEFVKVDNGVLAGTAIAALQNCE